MFLVYPNLTGAEIQKAFDVFSEVMALAPMQK